MDSGLEETTFAESTSSNVPSAEIRSGTHRILPRFVLIAVREWTWMKMNIVEIDGHIYAE